MKKTNDSAQIKSIVYLRAIAILLVVLDHFANNNIINTNNDFLYDTSRIIGWTGVAIFFAISGFVLPYSLFKYNYTIRKFFQFMWKRIVRIEPPYIVGLLFTFLGYVIKYFFTHVFVYKGGITGFFSHFIYLNGIINKPWARPFYWTLALEFQFYLFIGLAFPLIRRCAGISFIVLLTILCCLRFLINKETLIFYYFPVFMVGTSVCMYWLKRVSQFQFIICLFISILCSLFYDHLYAYTAIAEVVFIVGIRILEKRNFKFLFFIGTISYSIYLMHAPYKFLFENTFAPDSIIGKIITLGTSLVISLLLSYLLYRFIEKPFHKRSKHIQL